ncbi:MAG TPA: ABC transporter C-terminal domain-containing protein, partial [Candidatus Dormibacteraeota bacterium]|nr:ABC transporter C-terminal domain-containing protein [Candidatus Dormibacteraeota bacterium]
LPAPRAQNIQVSATTESSKPATGKKKLSYNETRELEKMEENISAAEEDLERKRVAMEDPAIVSDGPRLHAAALELEQAQQKVEHLYTRWAELEQKQGVTSESLG